MLNIYIYTHIIHAGKQNIQRSKKINFHENPEWTHADGFGYCPWTTLSSDDWKGISVKRSEMDSEFGLCIFVHSSTSYSIQDSRAKMLSE